MDASTMSNEKRTTLVMAVLLVMLSIVSVGTAAADHDEDEHGPYFGEGNIPTMCRHETTDKLEDGSNNPDFWLRNTDTPVCHHMRSDMNGLDSPKVDVLVSASMRSISTTPGGGVATNGLSLAANYVVPNTVIVEALGRLYDDGRESGEVPDFFRLSMVRDGVFFGAWEGVELIAAAGTHLTNPAESVGAVGNVYTRRDRRGRGLAALTTAAVSRELVRQGCRTVALNVSRDNPAAIRAYERAGFRIHCPFYEGLAVVRRG